MVVEHCVFFKNKFTEEEEKKVEEAILSLKKISYVLELNYGKNFSEGRCAGYTHGLRVTFACKEDLDKYQPSEEHQKVVSFIKTFWESSPICLDWEY